MARLVETLDPARVRTRLEEVEERVERACERAGRSRERVELLAATKYVPVDQMGALAEAGIGLVGENVASSLEEKQERWGDRFAWDFIGHLQSRKTKAVLPRVRLIHSVESESVLQQVERHAPAEAGLLLEVNVAGEESKYGVPREGVERFLEIASGYERVRFKGLMTMPPLAADPEDARPYFATLRELAADLERGWAPRHSFSILSMGTSQDYEAAVEEGATICRLGGVLYA